MKFYTCLLTVAVLGIGLAGCNQDKTLGTIHGNVTYDGDPVKEGTISFRGVENGVSVSDELDSEGKFEITAAGGIAPGTYQVFIVPPEVEVSIGENVAPILKPKDMKDLPKEYRSIRTTPLKADITTGENEVSFELKK
ncbi:carboxypeptidase-like regulatory domain-containing protein [Bremerella sp. T1]|uniref:carboxypeptidase-like regulatory domain-containing protein n=1 Tax=Bremerella sp. TYQ1 TaxID=3119568 RepID=UPI001CCF4BB8|nr:carboxypeptidase-like regulatory domain-containing protein [Bremerella volcania]UBM36834.1 carboxypeptidase-like regulatory domain-containing protein [Bremerella volcania]